MRKLSSILFFLVFALSLNAEYRVYQYSVKPQVDMALKEAQLITTTLDPVSFVAFNGGNELTKVSLLKTWKCVGYTGQSKPLCASPSDKLEQQLSNENEARNEN